MIFQTNCQLGVYEFPFPLGDHHHHPRLEVFAPDELVQVEDYEVVHPKCAFVWRKLTGREGWVIQRQRFAEIDYMSFYIILDT